jgi:hypothetical protein
LTAFETHGLYVQAYRAGESSSFSVYFLPPGGRRFEPGVYRGVAERFADRIVPGVRVQTSVALAPVDATLTVHEAGYAPDGALIRFAADFSQETIRAQPPVVGSIRMNAGDDECEGAPPGAPCDDRDACTPEATCLGGACVPAGRIACAPAPDDCHDAAICDPPVACAAPQPSRGTKPRVRTGTRARSTTAVRRACAGRAASA